MLREKIYRNIASTIDLHARFESSDFNVTGKKEYQGTALIITYINDPKYSLKIAIPHALTANKDTDEPVYAFSGIACPGPVSYEESFKFYGAEGIYRWITTWLDCIWEELSYHPMVKQLESQQTQINEIIERFETAGDEYFTKEEAINLKERLEDLEAKLREEMEHAQTDKKTLQAEVSKLHNDIETLKLTIDSLKKQGWVRSFASKMFKWSQSSENRKMLKDGYSVIRELLPENIKGSMPEIK